MKDEFKERLSNIGPKTRWPKRKRAPAKPGTLLDLEGVTRDEGVLILERSYAELLSKDDQVALLRDYETAGRCVSARDDVDAELRGLLDDPQGAAFVDTETTGLAGNMVFMLGVMSVSREGIRLRQVFARHYGEEPALLEVWRDELSRARTLVSFNGKSFDLPVLRDRLALHGLCSPDEPTHVDLLHHARRRWKEVLPNCTLQVLEWKICGRRRAGDIPGHEIPEVYHHFVRTGDRDDILTVFHHNALDLITMAELAVALAAPADESGKRRP
jgi:uncharacterized protein YprB with RNaseH-like and TPR domain